MAGLHVLAVVLVLCAALTTTNATDLATTFSWLPAPEGLFAYSQTIRVLPNLGQVLVVATNAFNGASHAVAFFCDIVQTQNCRIFDLSALAGDDRPEPSRFTAADVSDDILAVAAVSGSFSPYSVGLYICSLSKLLTDGSGCSYFLPTPSINAKILDSVRTQVSIIVSKGGLYLGYFDSAAVPRVSQCSSGPPFSCIELTVTATTQNNFASLVLYFDDSDEAGAVAAVLPVTATEALQWYFTAAGVFVPAVVEFNPARGPPSPPAPQAPRVWLQKLGSGSETVLATDISDCTIATCYRRSGFVYCTCIAPLGLTSSKNVIVDLESDVIYAFFTTAAPERRLGLTRCLYSMGILAQLNCSPTVDVSALNSIGNTGGVEPKAALDPRSGRVFVSTAGFGIYSVVCNGTAGGCRSSCPASVAANSTLVVSSVGAEPIPGASANRPRFTVTAGAPIVLSLSTRDAEGLRAFCATDTMSLVVVDGAATLELTVAPRITTQIDSTLVIRRSAEVTLRPLLNGAALESPDVMTFVVRPSALSDELSSVAIPDATYAGIPAELTVTARDPFGNPWVDLAASAFELATVPPTSTTFAPPRHLGDGLYAVTANFSLPTTMTLAVSVRGVALPSVLVVAAAFCPPGTFHTEPTGRCLVCPADSYASANNSRTCEPCPRFSFTSSSGQLATSSRACIPFDGYVVDASGALMVACPGGSAACQAGSCTAGYGGYLCKDCLPSHYAEPNGLCAPCPPGSTALLAVYFAAVCGLALLALLALLYTSSQARSAETLVDVRVLRSRTVPPSLGLVVGAFQIIGVLALANFGWSSAARRALNLFNVFSLDLGLFASSCALRSFGNRYVLAALTPLVFAATLVAVWGAHALARRVSGRPHTLRLLDFLRGTLFLVAPLAYLPLGRSTLLLFACRKLPNGRWYNNADLRVECYVGGGEFARLLPLGILATFVYVALTPSAVCVLLVRARARLFSDPEVMRLYSSLYRLVRQPAYLYTVATLIRRLAFVLASLFLATTPALQALVYLAILGGGGLAQTLKRPFYFPLYDRFEGGAAIAHVVVIILGALFYSERGRTNSVATDAVTAVFIATLVVFVAFAAATVVVDVRSIVRAKRKNASFDAMFPHDHAVQRFLASRICDVDDADELLRDLSSIASDAPRQRAAVLSPDESFDGLALSPIQTQ